MLSVVNFIKKNNLSILFSQSKFIGTLVIFLVNYPTDYLTTHANMKKKKFSKNKKNKDFIQHTERRHYNKVLYDKFLYKILVFV